MPSAVLAVYDRSFGDTLEFEVSWSRGHDVDAKMLVPKRYARAWEIAAEDIRRQMLTQDGQLCVYPTLQIFVTKDTLTRSASGFFALAQVVFDSVAWKISPPYPEPERTPKDLVI